MINSISKPKIPKGYSYVLKTNQLKEFLDQNNHSIHVDLVYWLPKGNSSILEVHFWQPNENIDYDRLYMRAGALANNRVAPAREKVESELFPALNDWLNIHLNLPKNSPLLNKKPYFDANYIDGNLVITEKYW